MAELGQLTPEQMLMLQQMGLLSPNTSFAQAGGGTEYAGTNVQTATSDDRSFSLANIGGSLPTDYGSFRGGLSANQFTTPERSMLQLTPNLAYQAGPVTVSAGRQFSQSPATQYGGSVNLGPVELGYQRQQMDQGGASNTYMLAAPLDAISSGSRFNASMTKGDRIPTQYQAGLAVPGLLGGVGEAAIRYTPEVKDTSVFVRYKRQF